MSNLTLDLERLRGISVPRYFSKIEDRSYVPECRILAQRLNADGITEEYLACLCSLLSDIAPHLDLLTDAASRLETQDPLDAQVLQSSWLSCPVPIREFIFEKGLLKNTSRDPKSSLRLGFLWNLVLRNKSSNNIPSLAYLLGLYMRLGRSQTEKLAVLSKLRVCPSKTTLDLGLPGISQAAADEPLPGAYAIFSFDNHQQQFSMTGGAKDLIRINMAHSVTRSVRYVPSLPPRIPVEAIEPLGEHCFKANSKEKAQLKHANLCFLSFASSVLHLNLDQHGLPPELLLGEGLDEFLQSGGEEEEEEEDEDQEGPYRESRTIDPSLAIEDLLEQPEASPQDQQSRRQPVSSLPPIYPFPKMDDWPDEEKVMTPEDADAFVEDPMELKFSGKSVLKMMPQLLGRSEDPEMVRTVLNSIVREMDRLNQPHAFVMCDEKLYTLCLKLCKRAPQFSQLTFLLDPFHLGWNIEKVRLIKLRQFIK